MKIIKNLGRAIARVWHLPYMKYTFISVIGITIVCFVGENSLMSHLRNVRYISSLADEIEEYETSYKNDMRQIRELNRNPKAMERIARERYFMKHEDEEIFVLSDDNRTPQSIVSKDETVE